MRPEDFDAFHEAVHGRRPFSWQSRLLAQVVRERRWPRVLDLPTGTGKTTCLDIAVFALALDAEAEERWCPRRIAMVVDRRIVVDQIAERGRKLAGALARPGGSAVLSEVARRLRGLCSAGDPAEPLQVFTLRGGVPKDDGWARTPDQPLVLSSTVDQLGSRLLMQGYGVSAGMRPIHAGLVGNDLLLLLDEVHLSQPFADTLEATSALRARFERGSPIRTRFQHVFLSATPGHLSGTSFRLEEREHARTSPLGARLAAPKPARLVKAADRIQVEEASIRHARELALRHHTIAVVVNRVSSAVTVARQLREHELRSTDVVLLTGRMRPLDRDDVLRALRPRVAPGRDRSEQDRKLIVVGTQCLEAGADFDFDAIVTEAASLDALRQRFGRVDRLGEYGNAEGVIVLDKSAKDDPIYGTAMAKTFTWLSGQVEKKAKTVDLGVLALALPQSEVLEEVVTPKPRAPTLLPAYLDLWAQTAPAPASVPDVGLWLHGPSAGPADVQVIWRQDLDQALLDRVGAAGGADERFADGDPIAIVAAVRPSALEAMPIPFVAAKRWLGGQRSEVTDVSVVVSGDEGPVEGGRWVLRWRGEDSEVVHSSALRPGDTVVVSAEVGGIRDGCFDPEATAPVTDLAERAMLFARGLPVLRLEPRVLAAHGLVVQGETLDEITAALRGAAGRSPEGDWRGLWLGALADPRRLRSFVVDGPSPWRVLEGRKVQFRALAELRGPEESVEDGVVLTTDEDDSFHGGRPVTLSEHSRDVEALARAFARSVGLPRALVEDVALAGWLHDVGKADRRFQLLLRGGSAIELYKDETQWAKSGMAPGARSAQRLAQRRSGYPRGARHEVQSVAMLEAVRAKLEDKAHDLDLVLHLVASHHGHCRPFAPVVEDPEPQDVGLLGHRSETFGALDLPGVSSAHGLHRLDSPLADRFWALIDEYGWLELCWLEAILRLADHRASEREQDGGES